MKRKLKVVFEIETQRAFFFLRPVLQSHLKILKKRSFSRVTLVSSRKTSKFLLRFIASEYCTSPLWNQQLNVVFLPEPLCVKIPRFRDLFCAKYRSNLDRYHHISHVEQQNSLQSMQSYSAIKTWSSRLKTYGMEIHVRRLHQWNFNWVSAYIVI